MVSTKTINDILAHFERTAEQFFSKDELRAKMRGTKKLRIKYGVDVTAPTLHIGHAVNMWLMRFLQDRGHKVVFLIGDFTTRIGDPSGKSDTRPVIPREEIENNARLFIAQAQMVLRFDDPNLIEIRRNSEWYDKMQLQDFMNLLSQVTHARLISRDMFQQRIEGGRDIHMHEMLYPILQGYDSVMVEADMTVIGSDQLFNEMMGRFFQEKSGMKPQTIVTTKITPGIDGKAKQSKSLGNYIGLAHSPRDKFGRVMSIPDELIEEYFRIYTDLAVMDIVALKDLIAKKPRDAKMKLAKSIVERYHGAKVASWEEEWFDSTVSKGLQPDDIPTLSVRRPEITALELVFLARPGKSKGDTRRLLQQGGVELNGDKLQTPDEMLMVKTNDILKVGKRGWFRIEIVSNQVLTTEHLRLDSLLVTDIPTMTKYLPAWEIVKYLTKPLSAWIANADGKPVAVKIAAAPAPASSAVASISREVFNKVITAPEPKDEWLWKIALKTEPDAMIGVAHLRRDFEHGNQNVWLVPKHQDAGLAHEAMAAINEHAFTNLGFNTMIFKEAFSHVAREEPDLRTRFMGLEPAIRPMDAAAGTWGVTKAAWQQTHPPAGPAAPSPMDPIIEEELFKAANPHLFLTAAAPVAAPPTAAPSVMPASPLATPISTAVNPPPVTPVKPPVAPVAPPPMDPIIEEEIFKAANPHLFLQAAAPPTVTPAAPPPPPVAAPPVSLIRPTLPFSPAAAQQPPPAMPKAPPPPTQEEEADEIRRSAPPPKPPPAGSNK